MTLSSPAAGSPRELTARSIGVGVLLGIVFGAANAYLGLKVGLTVSASIPAAVIGLALMRGLFRSDNLLETNMIQTIGSAGEALAAGIIFTVPALILLNVNPDLLLVFSLGVIGGTLGVLMMIFLRRYLVEREHGRLPFPEGTACARILEEGQKGGAGAREVFLGLGVGAAVKFFASGLKLWPEAVSGTLHRSLNLKVGVELYPALLGVGYIIGPRIAMLMFGGGAIAWWVIIPALSWWGEGRPEPLYPGSVPISAMGAKQIWHTYVRYIGAGAVTLGGIAGLIRAAPALRDSLRETFRVFRAGTARDDDVPRTDRDLSPRFIGVAVVAVALAIFFHPAIPVGIVGTLLILLFGFLFVAVSARIAGLVGNSSNPASGMTIATLLFTSVFLVATGQAAGTTGMVTALLVGSVVCIAICVAGDTSQDLKTGWLLGATPARQQVGEFIGVATSAAVIGITLFVLHKQYTIGSDALAAPQATLMSLVVQGVMEGDLPWNLVFLGMGLAFVAEMLGVSSLAFALGIYLPSALTTAIILGGGTRWVVDRRKQRNSPEAVQDDSGGQGVLAASGLIAGDALIGVGMALLAVAVPQFASGTSLGTMVGMSGLDPMLAIAVFAGVGYYLFRRGAASREPESS